MELARKTVLVTFGTAIVALALAIGFFNEPEIGQPAAFLFFLCSGAFTWMVARERGWLR